MGTTKASASTNARRGPARLPATMLETMGTIGSTHGVNVMAIPSRKNTGTVHQSVRSPSNRVMPLSLQSDAAGDAAIGAAGALALVGPAPASVMPASETVCCCGG